MTRPFSSFSGHDDEPGVGVGYEPGVISISPCRAMLKLDRGFRHAADCLSTVEAWQRKSITLHIVDLGGNATDTASAAGKFMLTVLAGAAEMERNLTRERTRAALHVKRLRGERISPQGVQQLGTARPARQRLATGDGTVLDDRCQLQPPELAVRFDPRSLVRQPQAAGAGGNGRADERMVGGSSHTA